MDVASFNFNAAIAELNSFLARKDYETQAVNAILDKLNSLDFTFISPDAKVKCIIYVYVCIYLYIYIFN